MTFWECPTCLASFDADGFCPQCRCLLRQLFSKQDRQDPALDVLEIAPRDPLQKKPVPTTSEILNSPLYYCYKCKKTKCFDAANAPECCGETTWPIAIQRD